MNGKPLLPSVLVVLLSLLAFSVMAQHDPLYIDIDTFSTGEFNVDDLGALPALDFRFAYDPENLFIEPGVVHTQDVIDFELYSDEAVAGREICTRLGVYSVDTQHETALCQGSIDCCGALSLAPSRQQWDAPFYLTRGRHGSTEHNMVSAQLVELDGDELLYSSWNHLDVEFRDVSRSSPSSFDSSAPNDVTLRVKDNQGNDLSTRPTSGKGTLVLDTLQGNALSAQTSSDSQQSIEISLEGVSFENTEWNNADTIAVRYESPLIEATMKDQSIIPQHVVVVSAVDDVVSDEGYTGKVTFETILDREVVWYCPDDSISSCVRYTRCTDLTESCYEYTSDTLTVYVPHYSTIIIGYDNSTIALNVSSPDNESTLVNGESVHFNVSVNQSITLNYSLDGDSVVSLGSGTSFSTLLSGGLSYGALSNGNHQLLIGTRDQYGNTSVVDYTFTVNDVFSPDVSINMSNQSSFSGQSYALDVALSSSEHGNYALVLNGVTVVNTSLDSSRAGQQTITPVDGTNTLYVYATDLQGNIGQRYLEFDFALAGSCSDAIQNGDETGIDCGGSCPLCVDFSLTTDHSTYAHDQTVLLTVFARSYSSVDVTVTRGGVTTYTHTFTPAFSGAPIAETRAVDNTGTAGTYTVTGVMTYLNITETLVTTFTVNEPPVPTISVSMSSNATTIDEGQRIYFSSSVSGNTTPLNYKWDLNGDGVTDSTLPNLTYLYPSNGTFEVNLSVQNEQGNDTALRTITVRKLHNLSLVVQDNTTKERVSGAYVSFNDLEKNTTNDGRAAYHIYEGTFDLFISEPGYKTYRTDIDIEESITYYVNLTPTDESKPVVSLVSPLNETFFVADNVTLTYFVSDASSVTCSVYTRSESILWRLQGTQSYAQPNGNGEYVLSDLDAGEHEWKVDCVDVDGNTNGSSVGTFRITENTTLLGQTEGFVDDERTQEITTKLERFIESLSSLDSKHQILAEKIQLREQVEKSIVQLRRTNRDLNSLKWRKLNGTELEDEEQKIYDRIDEIERTVPESFTILSSSEFVGYPSSESIETALDTVLNETNLDLSKRERRNLLASLEQLQSLVTLKTSATVVEFSYTNGWTKKVTVITKELTSELESFEGHRFFEMIPEDLVSSANETTFFVDVTQVAGALYELEADSLSEYTYIVEGALSEDDTELIASVLMPVDLKQARQNAITGFALVDSVMDGVVDTIDVRLLVEIIIIILLIAVYLIYSFGSFSAVVHVFDPKDVKHIRALLEQGHGMIAAKNYDQARTIYNQLAQQYKKLSAKRRNHFTKDVTHYVHEMNVLYINNLLAQSDELMAKGDKQGIREVYRRIQRLYSIIPTEHKARVSKKSLELHKSLHAAS